MLWDSSVYYELELESKSSGVWEVKLQSVFLNGLVAFSSGPIVSFKSSFY